MQDIGPHPTDDSFKPNKRYRAGTDANNRGKLKALIARRKKQGRNTHRLGTVNNSRGI
jgi:hypothetical protein